MTSTICFILSIVAVCTNPGPGECFADLRNGGFESREALDGWQLVTYGPPASVTLDVETVHHGRSSLRVSAEEPTDTALGQDLALTPSQWYRFSGWIKTQRLECADRQRLGHVSSSAFARSQRDRFGREPTGRHALGSRRAGLPGARGRARAASPPSWLVTARAAARPGSTSWRSSKSIRPKPRSSSPLSHFARAASTPTSTVSSSNTSARWCRPCGLKSSLTAASRG